ncbi:MAG TPA: hypothetical protein DEA22_08945 [Blastocatellia bacterium]|nr:hypothetical protein [Blastocatellia bacterium]
MSFSRFGIFVFIVAAVVFTANCSYYNRIMARKNLVDGSVAYKDRKFAEAEQLFRKAAARDPEGETVEGRTAQVFLARTLHSIYIGDRQNKAKADEAIEAYKKALQLDANEQSSYKAVAGLLENLQRNDEWLTWVTERSQNQQIQPQYRVEAFTSLAAKQNTCANEITDTEKTKKTVKKDGKDAYQFVKPENPEDLELLKSCISRGTELINTAVALETDEVKNAQQIDIKSLTDSQLRQKMDLLKIFESARSYKASLTIQASRLAEMEGRTDENVKLKAEGDELRKSYLSLADLNKKMQAEIDERRAIAEEAANKDKAANKPAAK